MAAIDADKDGISEASKNAVTKSKAIPSISGGEGCSKCAPTTVHSGDPSISVRCNGVALSNRIGADGGSAHQSVKTSCFGTAAPFVVEGKNDVATATSNGERSRQNIESDIGRTSMPLRNISVSHPFLGLRSSRKYTKSSRGQGQQNRFSRGLYLRRRGLQANTCTRGCYFSSSSSKQSGCQSDTEAVSYPPHDSKIWNRIQVEGKGSPRLQGTSSNACVRESPTEVDGECGRDDGVTVSDSEAGSCSWYRTSQRSQKVNPLGAHFHYVSPQHKCRKVHVAGEEHDDGGLTARPTQQRRGTLVSCKECLYSPHVEVRSKLTRR